MDLTYIKCLLAVAVLSWFIGDMWGEYEQDKRDREEDGW